VSQPNYDSRLEVSQGPDFECDPDCEGGVLCDCERKAEERAQSLYENVLYDQMKDQRMGL
jgi:hypothetical protein